jgi:hypothetical protein
LFHRRRVRAEQFGDFVRVEVERWGKVVKASGAKPD